MVRGIGRLAILGGAGLAGAVSIALEHSMSKIGSGATKYSPSGQPSNSPQGIILDGSQRDLGPGPCSYRATGSKRSRRRKKR